MQENINKYGTTLHHPEHQLNEINTLAHCPPPQTAKIFHSRVKDGLNERGRFEPPESGLAIVQQVEDVASPVGAFVRECCVTGEAFSVPVDALWDEWVGWCRDENRREGTKAEFGRQLKAVLPEVRKARSRAVDRGAIYQGIGLQADTEEEQPDEFPECVFMETPLLEPPATPHATTEDVKTLFGGTVRYCPPDCVH